MRHFGFLLKDVSRLYTRNFERHAQGLGLTLDQCKVLAHLQRNEGLSQARLAELTDTDPMTLGRLIDRMAQDGWIERRDDPADRRVHCLHLRPKALPVLDEIWRCADSARAESFAGLSAADRSHLMKLMQHVHGNLIELMPDAANSHNPRPRKPAARAA